MNMKNIKLFFVFLLLVTGFITKAQLGDGRLGPVTISSNINTDGTRARVTNIGPVIAGKIVLSLSNSVGAWANGDKVLVILMAQNTGGGGAPTRNWQMTDINGSASGSSITVNEFAHTNWCTSSSSTCKIQVIRVNQYEYLTINSGGKLSCSTWNGNTGGVVAFVVEHDLTMNGTGKIDVKAKGFSNINNAGQGGPGAPAPPPTPLNTTPNPGVGNDGLRTSFPFFARGQCVSPLPGLNGGDGGTGGFQTPGFVGVPGATPETRQVLPASAAPKLLFLGNAGKEGNGGKGGSAGGAGSNGGNGGNPAPNSGLAGGSATFGGAGGNGGAGGGVVIVLAENITLNSAACIDISGTSGIAGLPLGPTVSPAMGGNGGDGGDAAVCIGYGAFGIKGQRGDGADGGGGGSGGSLGSLSMRVPTGNSNTITNANKGTYIVNGIGAGAVGGIGQNPFPIPGTDGLEGCPVDLSTCPTSACTVKKYIPYKWACHEAYSVLGDMDQATDFGQYIKFTKAAGSAVFSKKNGALISSAVADYYCIYYKCSKLLMAFEDDGNPPVGILRPECITTNPVIVKFEQGANLYWCKLEESPCGTCDIIHRDYYFDIITGVPFIPSSSFTMATAIDGMTGLQHSFGWVEFGNNGAAMSKFRYEDIPAFAINGDGKLFNKSTPLDICTKSTEEFRMEWIDLYSYYPCACAPPGGTGGTYGGGPSPNYEVYPPIPYIPALWDNPKKGNDGPPGDPGEGDDSNFEGEDFNMADEDGMSELVGIENISAVGKQFTVSPNPTGDQLSVLITGTETIQRADIKILDITGKVVFEKQGCNISNKTLVQDISKLQAGTYFISINAKNVSEVLKFIKQ
jgi:hypothetical protein